MVKIGCRNTTNLPLARSLDAAVNRLYTLAIDRDDEEVAIDRMFFRFVLPVAFFLLPFDAQ